MNGQVDTLNTVPCNECRYAKRKLWNFGQRWCVEANKWIPKFCYDKGIFPEWCPLPTDDGICPRCGADMTKQSKQGSKEVPCAECYLGGVLKKNE